MGPAESDRTPVLLCDGVGCDGYVWKYLLPELARDRLVVHFHYRGHGRTPTPRDFERLSISDCADDAFDVADAASKLVEGERPVGSPDALRRVILAGHSMGVQVSLEAFRRQRGCVAGLILLCGAYGTPLRTFRGHRLLEDALPFVRLAVKALPRAVGAFWRAAFPTELAFRIATRFELNPALVQREDFFPYLEHMARVDVELFVEMLAAAGRHTAREVLPLVDVPALVVAGDRDGFTPLALSEEMHQLVEGSELLVVRGGSHTAPIERPDEVTGAVATFVRGRCDPREASRRRAVPAVDGTGPGGAGVSGRPAPGE